MPLEVGDLDRARSRREPSHSEARAALCADALGWRILPSRARLLVHPGSYRDGALPPCHLQTELDRERHRHKIGRAKVLIPVTNTQLVCRLLLEIKTKRRMTSNT